MHLESGNHTVHTGCVSDWSEQECTESQEAEVELEWVVKEQLYKRIIAYFDMGKVSKATSGRNCKWHVTMLICEYVYDACSVVCIRSIVDFVMKISVERHMHYQSTGNDWCRF